MDGEPIAVMDLDEDVERRRRLALEDGLLGTTASGLFIRKGHGLDAAQQVVERRVDEQVFQRVAVRGRNELDAALGDGARRNRFELYANLVDDDDLRHVVLDRLDHHRVLQCWCTNLHAPRAPDPRVGDVPVAANFI